MPGDKRDKDIMDKETEGLVKSLGGMPLLEMPEGSHEKIMAYVAKHAASRTPAIGSALRLGNFVRIAAGFAFALISLSALAAGSLSLASLAGKGGARADNSFEYEMAGGAAYDYDQKNAGDGVQEEAEAAYDEGFDGGWSMADDVEIHPESMEIMPDAAPAAGSDSAASGSYGSSAAPEQERDAPKPAYKPDYGFFMESYVIDYEILIETNDFNFASERLAELPGNILNSSKYGTEEDANRSVYAEIRVSGAQFDALTEALKGFGTVSSEREHRRRLTSTTDVASAVSYMAAKEAEYARLLEMLGRTDTMNEMLLVEGRLSAVIYDLDYYAGVVRGLQSSANRASVTVTIYERTERAPDPVKTFMDRIKSAFGESASGMSSFAKGVLVFAAAVSAPAVLLIVVGALAWVMYRMLLRRRYL